MYCNRVRQLDPDYKIFSASSVLCLINVLQLTCIQNLTIPCLFKQLILPPSTPRLAIVPKKTSSRIQLNSCLAEEQELLLLPMVNLMVLYRNYKHCYQRKVLSAPQRYQHRRFSKRHAVSSRGCTER